MKKKFVNGNNLIIDLGMNDGLDTAYYLRKGYRVIAVEANPQLYDVAVQEFQDEIKNKRLVILNVAVWSDYETKEFFINHDKNHWSSLDLKWAGREGDQCEKILVNCVPVKHIFSHYGVPEYLKIDIEGADLCAIKQLSELEYLPKFISVEDCRFGFEYLEIFHSMGYGEFKLSNQANIERCVDKQIDYNFKQGSSGPLSDDVEGGWYSYDDMVELYTKEVRDRNNNRRAPRTVWWDIHCKAFAR